MQGKWVKWNQFVNWWSMILGRFFYKHLCNFHLSIKQCCAQSPVNTILWYFQLLSAEVSCNYHQIVSTEDRAKLYFKNEWTLVSTWVRNFWLPFKKEMCFNDPGDISLLHTFVKKGSTYVSKLKPEYNRYTGQFISEFDFNLS